jgi:hypothetical protein
MSMVIGVIIKFLPNKISKKTSVKVLMRLAVTPILRLVKILFFGCFWRGT